MSAQLISHSRDLKALLDDGYEVEIKAGHLVIHNVPYVNADKLVMRGALVVVLDVAGEATITPKTHVALFAGEHPCDKDGRKLVKIEHQSARKEICDGLAVDHSFSCKPAGGKGYKDYYEKMTTYIAIISSPAEMIDPGATARTRRVIESDGADTVFKYLDTASSRAEITAVSGKLTLNRIDIIGLGGTGSYVLDLVAKTRVKVIHLFDGDDYFQFNAFRSPGAASIEELRTIPKKVHYWADRYAPMRNGIVPHPFHIDASNADCLEGTNFAFICVDRGDAKPPIIEKLEALDIPFVDVGMGIELVDDRLRGILRVTTSTPGRRAHIRGRKRIGLTGGDADGIYSHNIQIADLNALNAAFAVIKWKKLCGFYQDFDEEHHTVYTLDGNMLTNEDKP